MPKAKLKFLQKPTCTTCRKAKAYLEKLGAELELRSLDKQKLSKAELDELIGDRDHKQFLSSRNELYRTRNMKDHPPTRAEAIQLMAEEPNLIRRPVVMRGKRLVLGYDEDAYKELVK
ncbi:MAG TPA: Spx/MgsR family RNA polymerase-binding regulatory protein [Methylomirabilota bacterium]|jgi:Spx/MgsR family transcriptional regulator|nr:Spx/MgsR family RNA polymerase-binding regulatory protein [Methylomirabilota bacterium]